MHLDEAIRHLNASLSGPPLIADDTGAVALAFGDVTVNLRSGERDEELLLDARLGTLKPGADDQLMALMEANRWPSALHAGILSLDFEGTAFLVHRFNRPHLSSVQLIHTLERFARRARHWRRALADAGRDTQP